MSNNTTASAAQGAPHPITARYGPLLTTAEAAEVLKCHPSHIMAMCQDGRLRATRLGDRWKVSAVAVAELVG